MKTDKKVMAEVDSLLRRISAKNRPLAETMQSHHRRMGNRPNSLRNCLYALHRADGFLEGPLNLASKHDLHALVEHLQDNHATSGVYMTCLHLRTILKRTGHDDKWRMEALATRRPKYDASERLVSEPEFQAIMRTGDSHYGEREQFWGRFRALLWLLHDTGLRIGEALNLECQHIDFNDGGVSIQVPDKPGCKTGARKVFAVKCKGPVEAWLSVHPNPAPSAPVFCGLDKHDQPWPYISAVKSLGVLSMKSGLTIGDHHLRFHDFRHTAATQKARLGWNEAHMRGYFGWGEGSSMPSHYVHLANGDMKDRVLRDSGIDRTGFKETMETGDDKDRLIALLQKLLTEKTQ